MENKKLKLYLARFTEWMQSRGWSMRTIVDYQGMLKFFFDYLKEHTSINSLEEIDGKVLSSYQTFLYHYISRKGKRLSFSTQSNRLSCIKAFFQYLYKTGVIISNPSVTINLPKQRKKLPQGIMSVKEVEELLNQPDLSDSIGFRDRTILEVLYATGMRNSELRNLRIYDVDFDQMQICIVEGKNAKDRILPIGEIAANYLQEYLLTVRPKLAFNDGRDLLKRQVSGSGPRSKPDHALFISKNGRPLTAGNLIWTFSKYVKKANLQNKFTPHSLRHSCATHMLKNGAGIRYIQELLGHASVATTQIYTKVEPVDLREIHHRFHPREKLND